MIFNIETIIKKLSESDYPLFVSEKQLQVSFALAAKDEYKDYFFYPELPEVINNKKCYIDLMISDGKKYIPIEFKYIVAGEIITVPGNNSFDLRDQSAIGNRKYACVEDVFRLEHYLESQTFECDTGYFLLITNAEMMWSQSRNTTTYREFDLVDQSVLKKGIHEAKGNTRFSTTHNPITLKNDYNINYYDYPINRQTNNHFKYLIIEVKKEKNNDLDNKRR